MASEIMDTDEGDNIEEGQASNCSVLPEKVLSFMGKLRLAQLWISSIRYITKGISHVVSVRALCSYLP